MMLVCSSAGCLCFTEGNTRCRVSKDLLQTVMLCFLRVLDRGSVIPLMYGNVAYPMQGSEGSTSSKNVFTNSSVLGVAFSVWVLITLEITVFGYPFEARATLTCFNSSDLLSSVVGRVRGPVSGDCPWPVLANQSLLLLYINYLQNTPLTHQYPAQLMNQLINGVYMPSIIFAAWSNVFLDPVHHKLMFLQHQPRHTYNNQPHC